MTYDEACKQVGYDRRERCPIANIYVWYAYKSGKAQQFFTKEDASACSKNIEKVWVNEHEVDAWDESRKVLAKAAFDVWYKALRGDYSISDELFNLCYSEAYDRSHHNGYDEVAFVFDNVYEFAEKVRKIK